MGIPFIDLNRGGVTDKEENLKRIADEVHGLSPKPVSDWGPCSIEDALGGIGGISDTALLW